MADEIKIPENLAEISDVFANLKKQIQDIAQEMKGLVKGSDAWKDANKVLDDHKDKLEDLKKKYGSVIEALTDSKNAVDSFKKDLGALGGVIGGPVSAAFESIKKNIKGFAILGGTVASPAIRELANPIAESGAAVKHWGKFLSGANDAMKALLTTQSVAREAFIQTGRSMKEADAAAKEYPQDLRRMSVATGLSTKEINELHKGLSGLGADAIVPVSKGLQEITGSLEGGISPAAVATTMYRALGIEAAESIKKQESAFLSFNQKPIETAKQLGFLYDASQQTKIGAKYVTEGITSASESLGIFGQKSSATASVWTTFVKAIGDNVPIQQTNKMVKELTNNIANMSVQNRAFITMMGGMLQGATALGGGLKMELEMRSEGGLEKNMDALTKTLSRFGGGQVITLEQAANNPQLEMQFQIQRQMLGELAGINSQEEQNRVLEVLNKVESGGMTQVEGTKNLKEVFETGQSIQEKQLTVLERMEQIMRMGLGPSTDAALSALNNTMMPEFKDLFDLATNDNMKGQEITSDKFKYAMGEGLGAKMRRIPENLSESQKNMPELSHLGDMAKRFSFGLGGGLEPTNKSLPSYGGQNRRIESELYSTRPSLGSLENMPVNAAMPHIGEKINNELGRMKSSMLMDRVEKAPEAQNIQGAAETLGAGSSTPKVSLDSSDHTITVKVTADDPTFDNIKRQLLRSIKSSLQKSNFGMNE